MATYGTQDNEKQNKNKTQYVLETIIHQKNNLNKTCHLLQTTGSKDEPNIVFMQKSERASQHGTQNVKTDNSTTQKTKKISNTDPTKKPGDAREG